MELDFDTILLPGRKGREGTQAELLTKKLGFCI